MSPRYEGKPTKLKADLMNMRVRWQGVSGAKIAERCRTLGMREEDVTEIASLVKKAQEGRRLIPQKTYRNFRFDQLVDEPHEGDLPRSRWW